MEFFTPPPEPPGKRELPAWWEPPTGILPAGALEELTLVRTDEIAVLVRDIAAYPNGFEFTVCAFRRREDPTEARLRHGPFGLGYERHGDPPPELLRYGVQFSDSRKATTLDFPPNWDRTPEVVLNTTGNGHYSSPRWDQRVWVWPLPPQGPLVFACEWPKHGVGPSRGEIDASAVLEAAQRAVVIWPDAGGQ